MPPRCHRCDRFLTLERSGIHARFVCYHCKPLPLIGHWTCSVCGQQHQGDHPHLNRAEGES